MAKKNEAGIEQFDEPGQDDDKLATTVAPSRFKIGQTVGYVISKQFQNVGQVRPATVTKLNDDGTASLCVMIGDDNDFRDVGSSPMYQKYLLPCFVIFQVRADETKATGTFHRLV
jgi:hypothetical protein